VIKVSFNSLFFFYKSFILCYTINSIKGGIMWFFKKNKIKNKEEINLKINTITDDIFLENTLEEHEKEVVEVKSYEQLREELLVNFEIVSTKNNRMIKEYYICKIFSRVGLKDLDFNLQIIAIDKNVNRIKKDCFYLSRVLDNIKVGLTLELEELNSIHKQVMDLKAFQAGVIEHLTELNNGCYGYLKISTVTVTINKTNEELETLYNSISNEISVFKTFEEASEYIYYNSGEFIEFIVKRYIDCIAETANNDLISLYNKSYFLPSDAVISLDIKEWIELYNKLKFVLKHLSKYKTASYPSCYDLFNSFEAKYAILMMRTERKKK